MEKKYQDLLKVPDKDMSHEQLYARGLVFARIEFAKASKEAEKK